MLNEVNPDILEAAPDGLAAFAEAITNLDDRLRKSSETMNAGIAEKSAAEFEAWFADLESWYRDLCPIAMVLEKYQFDVPQNGWLSGDSEARLRFLNAWADRLPTLRAYFRQAPLPDKTLH